MRHTSFYMRHLRHTGLTYLFLLFLISGSAQNKRLITQSDIHTFEWLANPQISSDG